MSIGFHLKISRLFLFKGDVLMKENEILNIKVFKKMQRELDTFIADIKTKPSADMIEFAYELVYKEDILQSFDFELTDNYPLTNEQAKALLAMKYPLDYLYQEWLDYDNSALDMLRESNNLAIEKQIEYLKTKAEKDKDCR